MATISARETSLESADLQTRIALLERELREAFDRAAVTSEILQVINSSPKDAQPVFETIVASGLKLFPEATVSVSLRQGEEVRVVAIAGPDPASVEAWRQRFPAPVKFKTPVGLYDSARHL